MIRVMLQTGPDWAEEFRAARGKCGTKNSQPDKVIRTQMVGKSAGDREGGGGGERTG